MRPPPSTHSTVALKRWSCKSKELPLVQDIKTLHVYDFDNTLFMSPLPNPALWIGESIGKLQSDSMFLNGGWWHDPAILAATGEGVEKEELRAWQGHWNEIIVKLVETSITQKDALTVLLTGRGETNFADLINRILNARGLDFDLVCLKPEAGPQNQRFANTMDFKQALLRDLCFTYNRAENIVVYEDRPKHVKGFREFFERFNKSLLSHRMDEPPPPRKPIVADVVHVCEMANYLDMETEASEIAKLLKRHNTCLAEAQPGSVKGAMNRRWTIKENYIYCGYLISAADSARLISLANIPSNLIDSSDVRLMANNILISPHQPSSTMLDRVGGRGKMMTWQVTGIATLENRIWAAKVQKVGEGKVYTHDPNPVVVLGCRKGTRPIDAKRIQKWTDLPADQRIVFETVVGDKVVLALEQGEVDYIPSGDRGGQLKQSVNAGTKRRYRDRGSKSPEYQGRENIPFEGARRVSDMNGQNEGGMERNDGSWVPAPIPLTQVPPGRQGNNNQQNGNRNFSGNQNRGQGNRNGGQQQGRYFNQQQNGDGNNQQNQGQGQQKQARNQNRGGQQNRNRGGRGVQQGPQGYKSLDDYGPSGNGGLDGANDPRAGNGMEMNY